MKKRTLSTRNQLGRFMAIHDRLSTGFRYSLLDLIDACEARTGERPSARTVYNDLRRLKDEPYNAPIPERDRADKPYWYTEKGFSLYAVLNPQDAALANEAAALLKQVSHLPQFAGLEDVFLKFEQRAGLVGNAQDEVVQWELNPHYTGTNWLKPLYEYIQQDCQVFLHYTEFASKPVRYTFSPYLLKEYNNRWHIYGWADETKRLMNLALDRITELTPLANLRRRPCDIDWPSYLADIVGFTRTDGEPCRAWKVRVYFPRAHYLLTKPLHHTQDPIYRTDGFIDFKYQLIWNREFEAALFELGPDAELLEPADKRVEFAQKVKRLMGRYKSSV